jgi:exonuclease SbcD
LHDLLDRAEGDLSGLADAWVKVVLTDPGRLANPMEQLRAHWPHTLVLEFAPERDEAPLGLTRLTEASDPVEICAEFVSAVSGDAPTPVQRVVLAEVVLAAQRVEASA